MPADYDLIRADNKRKYGEEISRIGGMLLANRYDDPTHFIFEILQNAEDALKKRGKKDGQRAVEFSLSDDALTISHFGKPFDEQDVLGVCGIGESTKGYTDIGRFGIGFKSVYAFTERPEIHSGHEHFAIDSYVWPTAAEERTLRPQETIIHLPFRDTEESAQPAVLGGLRGLGLRTLLFLREIEVISWAVSGGPAGRYHRSQSTVLANGTRKVRIVGQDDSLNRIEEEWIVFSREVFNDGKTEGNAEVAFLLNPITTSGAGSGIHPVIDSPLVAFFPTALSTYLGFLVQGPYRTTPSRDNVPEGDRWNRHLVRESSVLLEEALEGLRELGLLDTSAIQCLPLDASRFAEGSRFALLFQQVRQALKTKPLLPAYHGGHVAGQAAKLAGTQELRTLIGEEQLASLFPDDDNPVWLSDVITANRTPELHRYLVTELGIDEVTPEWLVPRLSRTFLEAQSDEWMERLYIFLNGQRALLGRLQNMPVVRLEDGSHTPAFLDSTAQAYLPGDGRTGFPTVKRAVCQSDTALAFLKSLALRVPDPVDDVIANVIPKYQRDPVDIAGDEYQSDISRILAAFGTDSTAQRANLLSVLRQAQFVIAVDAASEVSRFVRPGDAYLATQRLKTLFEGVQGISFVDDSKSCLRGETVRDLLRSAGTPEYLVASRVKPTLPDERKRELRRSWGDPSITSEKSVKDYTLRGLDPLLEVMASLPADQARNRAKLLWQALCDVQQRRSDSVFTGRYTWFRYSERHQAFPARFVQTLNESAWVPDKNGSLQPPRSVPFRDTGWEANPSLASRIHFEPDALNQLAATAEIDLDVLNFVKKHNITLEELKGFLGETDDSELTEANPGQNDTDSPVEDGGNDGVPVPSSVSRSISETRTGSPDGARRNRTARETGPASTLRTRRGFISYVTVSIDEDLEHLDGLNHQERMQLEEQAITLILNDEPMLRRTPPNNAGFDLTEPNAAGETIRWIEVKAMKGTLKDYPVGLSRTQFTFAQQRRDTYWLYIVENAGNPKNSRIIQIRDPAGKARTFTFDHGWTRASEGPK